METSRNHRKPTLEDVARAAGVSRALVSIVMRDAPGAGEHTRARVLEIAGQLGYRPDARARLLARASSRLLGVVYRVDALHHADLLGPVYDAAEAAGYELILSGRTRRHDERRAVNTLLDYRCDAVLMLGPDLSEPEINRLAASVPVVLAGRRMVHPSTNVDSVRTDENAGLSLAVEHLVGLGHRNIVHVDGGQGTIASDRRRGFRTAMTHHGLRGFAQCIAGDGRSQGGQQAGEIILAMEPRPTGVIAFNDETAWGVIRAARRHGLAVPDAMSVVGYDGGQFSQLAARDLTTVRQDAEAIGRASVLRAIERLEGQRSEPVDEVLRPGFVAGETTGPIPS